MVMPIPLRQKLDEEEWNARAAKGIFEGGFDNSLFSPIRKALILSARV